VRLAKQVPCCGEFVLQYYVFLCTWKKEYCSARPSLINDQLDKTIIIAALPHGPDAIYRYPKIYDVQPHGCRMALMKKEKNVKKMRVLFVDSKNNLSSQLA
jgi:hypothetical protein